MTEIKIGDRVTWRKKVERGNQPMGIAGCYVKALQEGVPIDGKAPVPGAVISHWLFKDPHGEPERYWAALCDLELEERPPLGERKKAALDAINEFVRDETA